MNQCVHLKLTIVQNKSSVFVVSEGMAGHLLCQKEVWRQLTAAGEDNARHRTRRVSSQWKLSSGLCFFKNHKCQTYFFPSPCRKIRHYVAIKKPHMDNNNQVSFIQVYVINSF